MSHHYELKTYDGKKIVLADSDIEKVARASGLMKVTDIYGTTHYINPSNVSGGSPYQLKAEDRLYLTKKTKGLGDGN